MSSWWSIDLFVIGDCDRLEEFDDALPSLFHEVGEVDRQPCGAVVAHVAQNYGGEAAIEAVIRRYPDLIFSGTMTHGSAQLGDMFWGFSATQGEAKWAAFSLPDEDFLTRPKVERWASRIDTKIARLTQDREFCAGKLVQIEGEEQSRTESETGEDEVLVRTEKEVRAILNKLMVKRR
jgi:hypothetical protein